MIKRIFMISFLSVILIYGTTACSMGSVAVGSFTSFKGSAVVMGNDVIINLNGKIITASGEAPNFEQSLKEQGDYFRFVEYQDSTGGNSYKIIP